MAVLKAKSSSLLETIVAMVIIMVVFSISIMIYVNITSSTFSLQKIKTDLLLQRLSVTTLEKKTYFDETIEYEIITIDKQIQKYNDIDDILLMTLTAYNKQQDTIAQRKQLLLVR